MKTSFKVFLFAAALSLTVIYSKPISKKVVESYSSNISAMSVPSPTQICYQLTSR